MEEPVFAVAWCPNHAVDIVVVAAGDTYVHGMILFVVVVVFS